MKQQEVFLKEADKLLKIGNRADPYKFRTVNDVLAENHVLKKRNAILEETLIKDIEKLNSKISQTEMSVKHMKERMDRETSSLKQEQDKLRAASNTETNKLENDIIQIRGTMDQLPGKWSGGSY